MMSAMLVLSWAHHSLPRCARPQSGGQRGSSPAEGQRDPAAVGDGRGDRTVTRGRDLERCREHLAGEQLTVPAERGADLLVTVEDQVDAVAHVEAGVTAGLLDGADDVPGETLGRQL